MVLAELIVILLSVVFSVLAYFKWIFQYWEKKKVPFRKPTIPFGNYGNPMKRVYNTGYRIKEQYDYFYEQGLKHAGIYIFNLPVYIPIDRDIIKSILVRDFEHFTDRGIYTNEKIDPLSCNLFCLRNPKWKALRAKVTPTFSSGKIKTMFYTLVQCGKQMTDAMDENVSHRPVSVNMKEMLGCFTTDVISSCAFGLESNSCKDPKSDFRVHGKRFATWGKLRAVQASLGMAAPSFCRALGIRLVPEDIANYFLGIVRDTVELRQKTSYYRNDFIQLLLGLKNGNSNNSNGHITKSTELNLDVVDLATLAFAIYVGGYETSATTMLYALLELCMNEDFQNKARKEIREVLSRHGGEFTYDAVVEMKYVEQIMDETLRMYPVVPVLHRVCTKKYNVPDADVTLEKGTQLFISILGMHLNPDFFPDPERFDPERFNQENKSQIPPFTYLPFGDGPRVCIGMRFGVMVTKFGLAVLLNKYRFSVNKETDYPVKYNPNSFQMDSLADIHLKVEKIR